MALVPILLIIAMLAVVGILGFGADSGVSKDQIPREVAQLLDGIPQHGTALGSPSAPITLRVYADLECPTVRLFAEKYLPSIIRDWVRTGTVRLSYRSLETDTAQEDVFFSQETAALAAGRQDKMWSYVLTFVLEQGEPRTDYVDEAFLVDIASQVPGLAMATWKRERRDGLLSKQVALGVHSAHVKHLFYTPSFLIDFTKGSVDRRSEREALKARFEAGLRAELRALPQESREDFPAVRSATSSAVEPRKTGEWAI